MQTLIDHYDPTKRIESMATLSVILGSQDSAQIQAQIETLGAMQEVVGRSDLLMVLAER